MCTCKFAEVPVAASPDVSNVVASARTTGHGPCSPRTPHRAGLVRDSGLGQCLCRGGDQPSVALSTHPEDAVSEDQEQVAAMPGST